MNAWLYPAKIVALVIIHESENYGADDFLNMYRNRPSRSDDWVSRDVKDLFTQDLLYRTWGPRDKITITKKGRTVLVEHGKDLIKLIQFVDERKNPTKEDIELFFDSEFPLNIKRPDRSRDPRPSIVSKMNVSGLIDVIPGTIGEYSSGEKYLERFTRFTVSEKGTEILNSPALSRPLKAIRAFYIR
jgi:hypothetical protein